MTHFVPSETCMSCGAVLTPDERTYLDGRFCERCTAEQAAFDPLADTWASIREAQRIIRERGDNG